MNIATHITTSDSEVSMSATKFCEDCRFCDATEGRKFAQCRAPQNMLSVSGDHLVSRSLEKKTQWRIEYCSSHRGNTTAQTCGPDAIWFEPNDAEQVAA